MKQAFKILSFLMLLFMLTAEDCADAGYEPSFEEKQQSMFQKISDGFEKAELGKEELKAFENRSVQMLAELVDYLNIYTNSSFSKEFRMKSKEMIANMFISDIKLNDFCSHLNLVEDIENGLLLHEKGNVTRFENKSISIIENFKKSEDVVYLGILEFEISTSASEITTKNNQLEIVLMKSEKLFGDESEKVWEVFFATIN